jgi:hypothetical protein
LSVSNLGLIKQQTMLLLQLHFPNLKLWEQHLAAIFAATPVKYTGMQAEAAPTDQKYFYATKCRSNAIKASL